MNSDTASLHRAPAPPIWLYTLIALLGMLVGLVLTRLDLRSPGPSRIAWPQPPEPRPRALGP